MLMYGTSGNWERALELHRNNKIYIFQSNDKVGMNQLEPVERGESYIKNFFEKQFYKWYI